MYVSVTCSLGSTETFSLLALCDRDHAPYFPGLHHLPNPPFYSPGNDRQTMWRSNSHGLCSRSDGCSANAPVINITFVNCLIFSWAKHSVTFALPSFQTLPVGRSAHFRSLGSPSGTSGGPANCSFHLGKPCGLKTLILLQFYVNRLF